MMVVLFTVFAKSELVVWTRGEAAVTSTLCVEGPTSRVTFKDTVWLGSTIMPFLTDSLKFAAFTVTV